MELCLLNAENIPDGCLLSVSAGGSRRQAALAPKQKFAFSNASTAAAVAAGGSGLKVDLLSVQGSACVASSELLPGLQKALGAGAGAEGNKDGHQIEVIVNPPGPHGAVEEEFTMKLNFNIKPTSKERDGAETSRLASSVNTARTDLEERHLPTDLLKQSALLDRTAATLGPAGPKAQPSPMRSSRRHHAALQARSYLDDHNILNFVERVLRTLVQDRPSDPWGAIAALLPEAAAAGAMPESIKPDGPLEKLEEEREEVKQPEWNMMPSVGTWYMIPTPVAKPQKDAAPPPAEVQEMPLSTRGEEVEHERAVAGQFVEDLVLAASASPAKAMSQGGTSPMFSAAETEVGTRHQPAKQSAVAKATEACAFSNQPWHMLASVGTWYSPLRPTPATEDAPKEFQVESAEVPYQATQETEWPQLPSVGTWFTPIEELPVVHEQVVSEAAGDNVKAMEVTSAPPRPLKGTGISSSTIVAFVLPSLDFEQLVASDQSSILVEEVKAPMNQFAVRSLRVELGAAEPDGVEIRMTIKNGSSSEAKALKAQILQAEESFLAEVEQRLASAQLLPTSASFKATNLQVMVRHTASFEEGPVDGHATASTMAPAATTMYATGNAMSSAMPTESQWATTFDTSAEEPSPPALPEATEAAEEPSQPALPQEDGKLAETEDDFIPKLLLDPYAMDDGTGTSPIQSAVSDGRLRKEREEAVAAAKRRAAKAAAANIPDFLVDPYALDDGTGTSPMQSAVSDARLRQERQEAQFATIRRSAEEEFSRADANNDGVITATEFAAWAYTKDGTSEVELATVAASFQAMDANQDGVLSKEEFESYYMAKAAEELPTPSEGQVLGAEVTEAALESVAHQLLTDIAKKADDHASYASGLMSDIQEGFLQAELANALQAATNRAASSVTASIAGSAAPLGSEGSLTVAEQIAAAAMAAAAAPPSTAATDSNMSQDAFEIPLASFATLGATPTVVSIESARSPGGAPQPVMPTEDRTPSASSGPGDAKELGAEMAAKDLVTDITNEQGFLQAELADALQAATNRAAASATGSIEGTAVVQDSEGSMTVAERLAAAATVAVAAPASTAAMETEVSQDYSAIPPLASFAAVGATPTVVSIQSLGSHGASRPTTGAEATGAEVVQEERTPSASSAPGDAKELGAEMAAKDLVSDITNKKEAPTPSDCSGEPGVTEAALDVAVQQLVSDIANSNKVDAMGDDRDTNTIRSDPTAEAADAAKAVQAAANAAAPASATDASLIGTAGTGCVAPELPKEEAASATDAMTSVADPSGPAVAPSSLKPPESTAAMESESSQAPIPSDLAKTTVQAALEADAAEAARAAEAAKAAAEEAARAAEAAKAAEQQVQQAVVAASFQAMDTNKDGVVSKEEFESYVAKASEAPKELQVEPVEAPKDSEAVVEQAAEPKAEVEQEEDAEAIQERVTEVLEENSRLRSENMALRVELDALLAMAVTPETTPPGTAK